MVSILTHIKSSERNFMDMSVIFKIFKGHVNRTNFSQKNH